MPLTTILAIIGGIFSIITAAAATVHQVGISPNTSLVLQWKTLRLLSGIGWTAATIAAGCLSGAFWGTVLA